MAEGNSSLVVEFMLLGFSDLLNLQGFLSGSFLLIYSGVLLGNGLIIVIAKVETVLQTFMYFFLRNFSFWEICYTSVILPRILVNLWIQKINITFKACVVQFWTFVVMTITENFLPTVMAYDSYVTVCKSLNYPLIMNHKVCFCLVAPSWISGYSIHILQTYLIFSLLFCGSNKVHHIFFCDNRALLKLAGGDTSLHVFSFYATVMIVSVLSLMLIIWSYVKIITTILKIPGSKGKSKAFSSCSFHLLVVFLYLGCAVIPYLKRSSSHSVRLDIVFSIMYTTVTPVFNHIIYSVSNKDVKFTYYLSDRDHKENA